ncbi:molybdenum cofactor guanylyltransferase [Luteibacter sp. CQ10]|uniref:molybdenum cofactor guanylyltransferase n=1 Tax=Luteibacter sp. CQ10 TaxID=2805821 RepID=UPI0034A25009
MIGGLILAGGLSSRMGRDKAMLTVGGETLLDRTTRILRESGVDRVDVSGARPGGIPDRYAQSGPLGGIASAASVLPDGAWLIVPVDMPRLHSDVLLPLMASSARAACWSQHPLPMMLRLDDDMRRLLERMMEEADSRGRSPFALRARLAGDVLPLDGLDTRGLVNCNTPDEWQEANA